MLRPIDLQMAVPKSLDVSSQVSHQQNRGQSVQQLSQQAIQMRAEESTHIVTKSTTLKDKKAQLSTRDKEQKNKRQPQKNYNRNAVSVNDIEGEEELSHLTHFDVKI